MGVEFAEGTEVHAARRAIGERVGALGRDAWPSCRGHGYFFVAGAAEIVGAGGAAPAV